MNKNLEKYVESMLSSGKDADELKKSLVSVGWSASDVDSLISKYSGNGNSAGVPVPNPPHQGREKPHSIVHIVIGFFSLGLLYIVATSTGVLFFQVINHYFEDALSRSSYAIKGFRTSAVHYSIAALFVAFPLYVLTLKFWFRGFFRSFVHEESRLTKWFTYIVLLLSSGAIVGDFISIIFNFLQGELGVRFLLKALTVLVIAVLVFVFYFFERRKLQFKKDVSNTIFVAIAGVATIVVILGIVLGFVATGSPADERARKFDAERVENLISISSGIERFAIDNHRLPDSLDEIKNSASYRYYTSSITDPETDEEYEYNPLSAGEYELCAKFNTSTIGEETQFDIYGGSGAYGIWAEHDEGTVCKKQTAFGIDDTSPLPAPNLPGNSL